MESKKICPLFSAGNTTWIECLGERCGWYAYEATAPGCALAVVANGMSDNADAISKIADEGLDANVVVHEDE